MKLVHFDDYRLGVLKGDSVVDVSHVVQDIPHTGPGDRMTGLIARFGAYRARLEAASEGQRINIAQVRLRAPLPRPGNIVCMAVNYMEDGTRSEPAPINAFHKAATAIIGPGEVMELPDVAASVFEGEAEMALVIGKKACKVKAQDAMSHVFGYINFIDGSARGMVPAAQSFFQMKSRDSFAPIGPWLVTADEIADPQHLPIRLWVNGVIKQDFNTSDMAHNIARCIEWASHIHTLHPGDILATGTNHRGLGALQDGDQVELETAGLGRLKFSVRDELKRTWERETRLQRTEAGKSPDIAPQIGGKYAPK
jgi:2-keto-4-pentenoate hydratase/2-oxohepta-3-ene-1,7-dioic acid hydratase in catechol pathway